MLLGGRAAEEIVFGAVTTGASDDLNRVADVSRAMVHEYAMGTSLSSLRVSAEGGAVSDRTRQMRDEEQQHLADEALRMAHADHPRAPRASSTRSRSRCCATRSSSARRSSGSWPATPRERARGAGDLRIVAAPNSAPPTPDPASPPRR